MARVKFYREFRYRPSGAAQLTVVYKAGKIYAGVKREAADQAVAEGRAEELMPAKKPLAAPVEVMASDEALTLPRTPAQRRRSRAR